MVGWGRNRQHIRCLRHRDPAIPKDFVILRAIYPVARKGLRHNFEIFRNIVDTYRCMP